MAKRKTRVVRGDNGYKTIPKLLDVPVTTVVNIVKEFKVCGTEPRLNREIVPRWNKNQRKEQIQVDLQDQGTTVFIYATLSE